MQRMRLGETQWADCFRYTHTHPTDTNTHTTLNLEPQNTRTPSTMLATTPPPNTFIKIIPWKTEQPPKQHNRCFHFSPNSHQIPKLQFLLACTLHKVLATKLKHKPSLHLVYFFVHPDIWDDFGIKITQGKNAGAIAPKTQTDLFWHLLSSFFF